MDSLPDGVLLHILSRLNDSADVARCRVASKAFDTVFPGLRSINLVFTSKWYRALNSSTPHPRIKPFHAVLVDLISKLESVESVCLSLELRLLFRFDPLDYKFYLTDDDFGNQWLPMVSGSLKSLSISDWYRQGQRSTNFLPLISKYCHNLVKLKLNNACLSMHDMSPMPTLTSLTLRNVYIEDKELNELNRCLPNLQVLNLVDVRGVSNSKIHFLNLKTCIWKECYAQPLTVIAPNLNTLSVESGFFTATHIEAPMVSQLHLIDIDSRYRGAFEVTKFENLKTLWLKSFDIAFLLSKFPITNSVKTLTLDSKRKALEDQDSKLTLRKVFTFFPAVTCLHLNYGTWLELEAGLSRQGCEVLDVPKGLKAICAHLKLIDPLLMFSYVACVLHQCVGLSEVSFLIHSDFVGNVSEGFMSRCMDHWPELKWRWGIWSEDKKDSWITDYGSYLKKPHLC